MCVKYNNNKNNLIWLASVDSSNNVLYISNVSVTTEEWRMRLAMNSINLTILVRKGVAQTALAMIRKSLLLCDMDAKVC